MVVNILCRPKQQAKLDNAKIYMSSVTDACPQSWHNVRFARDYGGLAMI